MTGTVAYILSRKAIKDSSISGVTKENGEMVFEKGDGTIMTLPFPEYKITFTSREELPEEGEPDTLYIVETDIEYWDETDSSYHTLSGGNLMWEPI